MMYYNFSVLEPLGRELRTKMNGNAFKIILFCYLSEVFLTFYLISTHKITKIHKDILNYVSNSFIL
jgi:hypothetical protein